MNKIEIISNNISNTPRKIRNVCFSENLDGKPVVTLYIETGVQLRSLEYSVYKCKLILVYRGRLNREQIFLKYFVVVSENDNQVIKGPYDNQIDAEDVWAKHSFILAERIVSNY